MFKSFEITNPTEIQREFISRIGNSLLYDFKLRFVFYTKHIFFEHIENSNYVDHRKLIFEEFFNMLFDKYSEDEYNTYYRTKCFPNGFPIQIKTIYLKTLGIKISKEQLCVFVQNHNVLEIYNFLEKQSKNIFLLIKKDCCDNCIKYIFNKQEILKFDSKAFYFYINESEQNVFVTTEHKKSLYKDIPQVPHTLLEFTEYKTKYIVY